MEIKSRLRKKELTINERSFIKDFGWWNYSTIRKVKNEIDLWMIMKNEHLNCPWKLSMNIWIWLSDYQILRFSHFQIFRVTFLIEQILKKINIESINGTILIVSTKCKNIRKFKSNPITTHQNKTKHTNTNTNTNTKKRD
jgi:hypothetical protein